MGEVWYPSMGRRYSEKGGISMEGWFPGLDRRKGINESSDNYAEGNRGNFSGNQGNADSRTDIDVDAEVDNEFENDIEIDNDNEIKNIDRNKNIAKIRKSGNAKICLDINVDSDSEARVRTRADADQDQDQDQSQSFDD
ncbi:hypothetical protein [Bacillus sp. EB01]|uniref:hypothetical protein n=1 Tax=Bacillus sp. EB01 TaxID=1347086 RepID=UPI0006932330|nr:hypothetical protein [Bacillus sp. EB01]